MTGIDIADTPRKRLALVVSKLDYLIRVTGKEDSILETDATAEEKADIGSAVAMLEKARRRVLARMEGMR